MNKSSHSKYFLIKWELETIYINEIRIKLRLDRAIVRKIRFNSLTGRFTLVHSCSGQKFAYVKQEPHKNDMSRKSKSHRHGEVNT